jgi:cytochrome b6-f complex iron-sulfur subunit
LGVTRRQFLNRSILGVMGLAVAGFGASMLAFLWPTLSGGFGSKVNAGKIDDILASIRDKKTPFYVPEARTYINPYPVEDVPKAKAAGYADPITAGMSSGVVALYQKCVHLGCRVPWCVSSQWFECPCHGSQYNRVGEKKGGPAPRGLDRFAVTVSTAGVTIDTTQVFQGPPIGTNTTGQEAEGPHCR